MDVFLVPVAPDRYELYCEEPDEPSSASLMPATGRLHRVKHRFSEIVAEAERVRRAGAPTPGTTTPGVAARIRARAMRWVAESVAEQRLLWRLRGRADASLFYPDDLRDVHAHEILRRLLNRDFERHRFWLAIDSCGLLASAILTLLPGPNLLAYYFAFRIVGHFLSMRGARQGLRVVAWHAEGSAPLSALRLVIGISPEARATRVHEVADTLRLEHFPSFFERTAIS